MFFLNTPSEILTVELSDFPSSDIPGEHVKGKLTLTLSIVPKIRY